MTIIFDLDYTLLDTSLFKKELASCLEDCGVSQKDFFDTYEEEVKQGSRIRDFDLHKQLARFKDQLTCDVDEAEKRVYEVVNNLPAHLFPGAVKLLKELREEGHHLILFTHGNAKWQKIKIRGAKLEKAFDEIIVTSGIKEDSTDFFSGKGHETIVMINDNPEEIQALKKKWPHIHMIAVLGPKGTITDPTVTVCESMEAVHDALHLL